MSENISVSTSAESAVVRRPEEPCDPLLTANKPILLEALRTAGAVRAVVCYSGSGDDGGANEVYVFDAQNQHINPDLRVRVKSDHGRCFDGGWQTLTEEVDLSLADGLSAFADRAIEIYQSSFEDGEGGEGDITFDVTTMSVLMEHREFYVDFNQTERVL